MRFNCPGLAVFAVLVAGTMMTAHPAAQAYAPVVHMSVTPPSGTASELAVPESGLKTVEVSGHEYGIRPTMLDDEGTQVVVTIFDMGSATESVKEIARVEVKGGGPAVTSKSTPAFKISVTSVTKSEDS
jgi:hypothetical protein